jgi:hypothetical protein
MQIDIPLSYQPSVGSTITIQLTGKVIAVSVCPMEPNSIMVTLDTGEDHPVGPNTPTGKDPFIATNAGPGSSTGYGG